MRFPHKQSVLETEKLSIGMEVGVAFLVAEKHAKPKVVILCYNSVD